MMNPKPLLPMYDNETAKEKAARQREQDLEDARPSPDDNIVTAFSKWMVRHPGVKKIFYVVIALLLVMKALQIEPLFSEDVAYVSTQQYDYGMQAYGADINPMDTEYSIESRRQLPDEARAEPSVLKGHERQTDTLPSPEPSPLKTAQSNESPTFQSAKVSPDPQTTPHQEQKPQAKNGSRSPLRKLPSGAFHTKSGPLFEHVHKDSKEYPPLPLGEHTGAPQEPESERLKWVRGGEYDEQCESSFFKTLRIAVKSQVPAWTLQKTNMYLAMQKDLQDARMRRKTIFEGIRGQHEHPLNGVVDALELIDKAFACGGPESSVRVDIEMIDGKVGRELQLYVHPSAALRYAINLSDHRNKVPVEDREQWDKYPNPRTYRPGTLKGAMVHMDLDSEVLKQYYDVRGTYLKWTYKITSNNRITNFSDEESQIRQIGRGIDRLTEFKYHLNRNGTGYLDIIKIDEKRIKIVLRHDETSGVQDPTEVEAIWDGDFEQEKEKLLKLLSSIEKVGDTNDKPMYTTYELSMDPREIHGKRVHQELEAIEKAFGAEQRVVGSEVSLQIKPSSSAMGTTSVIVKYQRSHPDKSEHLEDDTLQWTISSELAFRDIAPSVVKQELEEALKNHDDYAITKQQVDGWVTNYRISQDDWKKR